MKKKDLVIEVKYLEKERGAAVKMLRQLCADFGDNDWPDDLHLADVIDKHLGDHLYQSTSVRR